MNLLAITLCILIDVIIAERLSARFNTNKAFNKSGKIIRPLKLSEPENHRIEPHYEPSKYVGSFSGPIHFPSQSSNKFLYRYSYNTDTGIQVQEEGHLNNVDTDQKILEVQGSYSYTDNEANTFHVSYVADENGFHPQGDHLPDVSPLIRKALRYIAEHPEENGK